MKVKALRQRHPSYDGRELAENRALHEGGARWHALLSTWFPQQEFEPPSVYQERLKTMAYRNDAGPLIDMISAWLFAEPPAVEKLPKGDFWSQLLSNVDRAGTDWGSWWAERLLDAMVGRRAYAWVNLPAPSATPPASRADQEQAGLLNAYLVGLTPEEVIDWGHNEQGALSWLIVEQRVSERAGPEAARQVAWRWLYIDATVVRLWTWTPSDSQVQEPQDDDEAVERPRVEHGFGRMPVTELCLPVGLWAMRKLHDPAVALMRGRHDLDWWLNRSAHAMPVIKRAGVGGGEAPVVGSGYYIEIGEKDEFGWSEPPGHTAGILASDVKSRREDLYRVVQAMAMSVDGNAARSRTSGESKRQDWQAMDIVLAAYARLMHDAMLETIRLVGVARQEPLDGVTTKGLDGFQNTDLSDWLDQATMALPFVKSETFRKVVAKRTAERLMGDDIDEETLRKVHAEVDASVEDPAPYAPPPRPGQADNAGVSNE